MNFNLDVIKTNSLYFIGFFLYVFLGLATTEYYGRDLLQLELNKFHSPFFDIFFKGISSYGILFMIFLALYLSYKKYDYKTLFFLVLSYATAMLLTFTIKMVFFKEGFRPTYYFQLKNIPYRKVEGVLDQNFYTFPSGHSVDGFLLMLFFSCLTNNKLVEWACLLYAVLLAYSRIYLGKHFVIDTCGGAVLGVFIFLLYYYIFQKIPGKKWMNKISFK